MVAHYKKKISRLCPAETMIDEDEADDLALVKNKPVQAESLLRG